MKKLTTCVLSVGILMLTEIGDTEALFGRSKNKTDSVSFALFGADTSALITAANNLKTGLTNAKKSIATATVDIKKQTIDVKTFDKTSTVMPMVFISERLTNVGTFFETMASLLEKEINGLKLINNSKSSGNASEISGRQAIRLSRKVMKILEADLASVRANIALIHKLIESEKNKRISNAGAIKQIFTKLLTSIKNSKKDLVSLVTTYAQASEAIANTARDEEMQKLFTNSRSYIEAAEETVDLSVKLLEHVINYADTGDSSTLEEFSRECEELLATGGVALQSTARRIRAENDEELEGLRSRNRGFVRTRAEQIGSSVAEARNRRSTARRIRAENDEELEGLRSRNRGFVRTRAEQIGSSVAEARNRRSTDRAENDRELEELRNRNRGGVRTRAEQIGSSVAEARNRRMASQ